jgi:hypothetical protein
MPALPLKFVDLINPLGPSYWHIGSWCNLGTPGNSANTEALPVAVPQQEPTTQVDKSVARRPSAEPNLTSRLKKIAWRTTAAGQWLWWLTRVPLGEAGVSDLSHRFTNSVVTLLSSVGFRPVHDQNLGEILKIGWFFVLAGFRPAELVGLLIYIFLSPLTLVGYLIFREVTKETPSPVPQKTGLRPARSQRPALMVVSLSLFGWYLLYGEATSKRPLIVGAGLSGALFLLLLASAFQRVKPATAVGASSAWVIDRLGLSFMESIPETLKKVADSKKRVDAIAQIFFYKKCRKLFTWLALLTRGSGARSRLYFLPLFEYVFSLVVLGSAAILFWILVARAAFAPPTSSLSALLSMSAAYFLPPLASSPTSLAVPLWAQFGQAITAVLLFILYVGASASVLPSRQTAYADRIMMKYHLYRRFVLAFKQCVQALERMTAEFPR